jgi:hypothetical protein
VDAPIGKRDFHSSENSIAVGGLSLKINSN